MNVQIRSLRPLEQRISDLLADGQPRMAAGIVQALYGDGDFIARREAGREVQGALTGLRDLGRVHLLTYGVPSLEGKFVSATTVAPVCQSCFRNHWGADAIPAQIVGRPVLLCPICRRRTRDAAYVPVAELKDKTEGGLA
jgi:hypothetical protein